MVNQGSNGIYAMLQPGILADHIQLLKLEVAGKGQNQTQHLQEITTLSWLTLVLYLLWSAA